MSLPQTDRAKPEDPAGGIQVDARLDGWKEVAGYLARAERTVKRWESDRGLPIHRVPGGARASVFAFRSELDIWMKSHDVSDLETGESSLDGESEAAGTSHPAGDSDSQDAAAVATMSSTREGDDISSVRQLLPRRRYGVALAAGLLLAATVVVSASRGSHFAGRVQPNTSTTVSNTDRELARDLYLQGRFEWNKRTPESLNRALDDFTQSIVHDPQRASAYAGLSDTYVLLREYSLLPEGDAYIRAIAASKRAVQLDDSLAEAHRSLAFAEVWGLWDFTDAEKEFRRAIELDPNDSLTHLWFATAFEGLPGWGDTVLREFNRAQELDPASPVILSNKSIWIYQRGDRKGGLEMARQVERNNPDFVAPHRYLARMYWIAHDYPNFLEEDAKAASLQHDAGLKEMTDAARAGFIRGGEPGLLKNLYLARKALYLQGRLPGSTLAEVCVRLNKKDEALQLLQDDFNRHRFFVGVNSLPEFEVFRTDPRYHELMSRLISPELPIPTQE